jgi:hypothetical protein
MVEYRKQIELDPNTNYWFVEMGVLDRLNGGSSYPFPTYETAHKFAVAHKRIAKQSHGVDREIAIRFPNGTIETIQYE